MSRRAIVRLHAEAVDEAASARAWYQQRNPAAAEAFDDDLSRALATAAGSPARGVPVLDGSRRVLLRRFPYAVVYVALEDCVFVLAVAHSKRRPGYWRTRES